MRYLLVFLMVLAVAIYTSALEGSDEASPSGSEDISTTQVTDDVTRVYPIAPGVWYPGDPLPEKPMRYYRVRCWPGCHRGSSHGKYPEEPLNMEPIFYTRSLDLCPAVGSHAN